MHLQKPYWKEHIYEEEEYNTEEYKENNWIYCSVYTGYNNHLYSI